MHFGRVNSYCPRHGYGFVEFLLKKVFGQGFGPVGRDADALFFHVEEFNGLGLFTRAEDEADGLFLVASAFVPVKPSQIEFHLAFVGGFEFSDLEVDGHHATQVAMIEEQVEVVFLVVDGHALLPGDECEANAEFEDETFDFPQDGGFQILFGVCVFQAKKIENIGISKYQIGSHPVFIAEFFQLHVSQFRGLPREGSALEKHGVDFLPKRPGIPCLDPAHLRVKIAFERVVEVDDGFEVSPTQFCNQ